MMRKIFCFGDSVTLGEYDLEGGGWATRIQKQLLEEALNFSHQQNHLYNLGVASETTDGLRSRFSAEFRARSIKHQKALVVLQYGLNDLIVHKQKNKVPEAYFSRNLTEVIESAKSFSADCLLLTITPIADSANQKSNQHGDVRNANDIEKYNRAISRVARETESSLLDCHTIFSRECDHVLLSQDELHPNSKGHQIIFHEVSEFLDNWMNSN